MDPHSFFADPDPAIFLNTDSDPVAFFKCGSGSSFKKNYGKLPYEEFLELKKTNKCVLKTE